MPVPSHANASTPQVMQYVWDKLVQSEVAAFLDFQCVRRHRSLRTFVPSNRNRLPAWREALATQGEQP